jgi:predicted nucleic acid binding AN1-type Zn finger protein
LEIETLEEEKSKLFRRCSYLEQQLKRASIQEDSSNTLKSIIPILNNLKYLLESVKLQEKLRQLLEIEITKLLPPTLL